ncbi:MAG: hypothetical protein SO148_05110 [Candidatus Onthovivens sp.]|nr:hypothetical protein [Candidatus Onthovivens sp.]
MYLIKKNNKLDVYLVYDQELTKNYIIYKNKKVIFTTFDKIKALERFNKIVQGGLQNA